MQTLNYIENFSANTGCISISAFASSLGIPIRVTSFGTGLKICAIAAENKNYKSIIKKKKQRCMIK